MLTGFFMMPTTNWEHKASTILIEIFSHRSVASLLVTTQVESHFDFLYENRCFFWHCGFFNPWVWNCILLFCQIFSKSSRAPPKPTFQQYPSQTSHMTESTSLAVALLRIFQRWANRRVTPTEVFTDQTCPTFFPWIPDIFFLPPGLLKGRLHRPQKILLWFRTGMFPPGFLNLIKLNYLIAKRHKFLNPKM